MNKKSRHIRLSLKCLEKLELLRVLSTDKTKRQIAEKIIKEFFARVMRNEEEAKRILEIKAKLRVRQQIMEMALKTEGGKIVRVED